MKPLVVGVGNLFRGDDGLGPTVALRVRSEVGDAVDVVSMSTASRLLDAMEDHESVVIVDATAANGRPGAIRRFDGHELGSFVESGAVSTHGFGLASALHMAVALNRLPRRVTIVGVEGEAFEHGAGLSVSVAGAVDDAVALVLWEVGCTSSD